VRSGALPLFDDEIEGIERLKKYFTNTLPDFDKHQAKLEEIQRIIDANEEYFREDQKRQMNAPKYDDDDEDAHLHTGPKTLFGEKYQPKATIDDEDPTFTSLAESNKWYSARFVVVVDNGVTQIIRRHKNGRLVPFRRESDFFNAYAHKNFIYTDPETNKNNVIVSAVKWFKNPERSAVTFFETTFDPKNAAPPGVFNYWPGFGTKSVKGEPKRLRPILPFIYHVVCSKDKKVFKYVIRWCAHLVQRPWEKPGIALVLIGPKGVGKSQFSHLLERLIDGIRQYVLCHKTVKGSDIGDKFNDHLRNKLLLTLDEASYIGNPKVLAIINDITTSAATSIAVKFGSTRMFLDFLRLLILANPPWKLPMTTDERRFLVLNPSNAYLGNPEYYMRVNDAIENPNALEALMYSLMNASLTNFNVRVPPYTDAMLDQAVKNLKGVPRWFFEVLSDGKLEYWKQDPDGSIYVLKDKMPEEYQKFHDAYYPKDPVPVPTQFGIQLGDLLPALDVNGAIIKKKGKSESILDYDRQRDAAIKKIKPGIQIPKGPRDSDYSYSYVLPDLQVCRTLFNIVKLKNMYIFEDSDTKWRDRDPM
jgi:hypothetical protein